MIRMSDHALAPFDFPEHHYSERLIPRTRSSVSAPNLRSSTSSIARAIAAAGPLPGGAAPEWRSLRNNLITAVVGLAIALSAFIGEDMSISSGWQGLAVAVFVLFLVVAAGRNIRAIRSSTWGARRLRTASENGWIEYYPALLSEIGKQVDTCRTLIPPSTTTRRKCAFSFQMAQFKKSSAMSLTPTLLPAPSGSMVWPWYGSKAKRRSSTPQGGISRPICPQSHFAMRASTTN